MSMKFEEKTVSLLNTVTGATQDKFGLAVLDSNRRSPRQTDSNRSEKKQAPPTGATKPVYHNGVRVPILQDIENRYRPSGSNHTTCRFDIVETVKTVIRPGEFLPPTRQRGHLEPGAFPEGLQMTTPMPDYFNYQRENTFHSTQPESRDRDVWEKISPYDWRKHRRSGKKDARDVLYKHTYCPGDVPLRYRSLTLPEIHQDRPRTGNEPDTQGNRTPASGDLAPNQGVVTITPQQPRGTMIRFREFMRPTTYPANNDSLNVKRTGIRQAQNNYVQFSNVRNVFPLIRQDSRNARRVDRPMKFESSRYNRSTIFKQQMMSCPPSMFQRDYKSAETFKDYLDSLQQNMAKTPSMHNREREREMLSPKHSYHTRVLQTVVDVNKPEASVVAPPVTEEEVSQRPADVKSAITVEIKPSWQDDKDDQTSPDVAAERASIPARNRSNSGKSEPIPRPESVSDFDKGGSTCPTNTPTPREEMDQALDNEEPAEQLVSQPPDGENRPAEKAGATNDNLENAGDANDNLENAGGANDNLENADGANGNLENAGVKNDNPENAGEQSDNVEDAGAQNDNVENEGDENDNAENKSVVNVNTDSENVENKKAETDNAMNVSHPANIDTENKA